MSRTTARRVRILAGAILVAGLAAVAWAWWASRPPAAAAAPVNIVVEPGTSVRQVAARLAQRGVIRSPLMLEAWLRLRGNEGRIQAGTYKLPRDRSLLHIADLLVSGRTVLTSVTVPEALRLEEAAGVLGRSLGAVDSSAFVAAATDPALVDSLLPDSLFTPAAGGRPASLEGYLFPETYRVDPATGPREMVRLMVEQFWDVFTPAWRSRPRSLDRSVHEIVTLASIVDEEARVPVERTIIAGVFWNRLERGMPLEADPTVQYALGGHRARVLYRDLDVESPYNTYRVAGLPPGPIASPGRAALEATLHPDRVPYLFFFATGEGGRHTFSETLEEHNRKRRELGR